MKKHRPNCHHTPEKLAKNPPGVQCKCFCTCPEEEISNPTPSEASYGAHKTPEEIIAEFEERFKDNHVADEYFVCPAVWVHEDLKNPCDCVIKEIKSFLTESLAAYRLSVLSECEGLVEDVEGHGDSYPMTYEQGFNAANALWRERIDELKKK